MKKLLILILTSTAFSCGTSIITTSNTEDVNQAAFARYQKETITLDTSLVDRRLVLAEPVREETSNYNIINGVLYLTPQQLIEGGVNIASEWCSRTGGCKDIMLPFGQHEVKYNFVLHPDVNINSTFTHLKMYPSVADTAAIYFEKGRRAYASQITIENLYIELMSPAKGVIQTNGAFKARIVDCTLQGNKLTDNVLIVGGGGTPLALDTYVERGEIKGGKASGIHYERVGGKHRVIGTHIRQSFDGISGFPNLLIVEACQIENNDRYNINLEGGVGVSITNCTFEKAGIKLTDVPILKFSFNKMSGGDIELNGNLYSTINTSTLFGVNILESTRIEVEGNYWQSNTYSEFIKLNCKDGNTIKSNYNTREGYLKTCNE